MTRLRLRHISMRAETAMGRFGADIPLRDGLVILRADNSRGKSTVVKSILFALGLERMITTRPAQAVTSAMRERLIYDHETMAETPVLSSWVSVEMEGSSGDVVTVTRWIKHEDIDPALVRVVYGPALTEPRQYNGEDFYVGRSGAAANPRGFHRWLASFIGWSLPTLPSANGRSAPLYMEQIFPLLFVEQRRGWGGIQAQMPIFAGVPDVRRRAIEFLLDLDVGKLELERTRLRSQERELQDKWKTLVMAFKDAIRGDGLVAVGLPESLAVTWPPHEPPNVVESRGDGWASIDDVRFALRNQLFDLEEVEVPGVEAVGEETMERLAEAYETVETVRQSSGLLREDILRHQSEVVSLRTRLSALEEDLRQHQDIALLHRLGSSELERIHGDCPVCHQQLPRTLIGGDSAVEVLSSVDTIAYIKQQIELFRVMVRDTERTLQAKREQWSAMRSRLAETEERIRATHTTLMSPYGTPSVELVTRQVQAGNRIERLDAIAERFLELLSQLEQLAEQGRLIRSALAELPADRLSNSDVEKLQLLEEFFVEQLHQYEFGSFSDERLRISHDDYLPRRDEFDLQADISASDSIRVIWAYLIGLVEVAHQVRTNHPGFLVLDEPRQQSAKEVSFGALLRRASRNGALRQIIFATSEELGSLERMLSGVPHYLHSIEGYLLRPVNG